jgi:NADPH:quinone reductase-like Zn-dependent oxidoreductase
MTFRAFALIALAAIISAPLVAQTPSDEHKHWAEVTHKFESAPLDEDANHDAGITVSEIAVSHDFHVALCPELYADFGASKYEYHAQIRWLYMLGAATYQVESGKTDIETTNLYALHSVLKGYAAILRQEPAAKDKQLDELAKLDAKGKLAEFIAKKNCKQAAAP